MPSNKLEGSSVTNSVVDKLFVEFFDGVYVCACFLKWRWCGNVHFWSIQHQKTRSEIFKILSGISLLNGP